VIYQAVVALHKYADAIPHPEVLVLPLDRGAAAPRLTVCLEHFGVAGFSFEWVSSRVIAGHAHGNMACGCQVRIPLSYL
jgi:hypothetical protein